MMVTCLVLRGTEDVADGREFTLEQYYGNGMVIQVIVTETWN